MTEKAYRAAGVKLSDPVKVGDFERAPEFPITMIGLGIASKFQLERPLTADTLVYLPGNEPRDLVSKAIDDRGSTHFRTWISRHEPDSTGRAGAAGG